MRPCQRQVPVPGIDMSPEPEKIDVKRETSLEATPKNALYATPEEALKKVVTEFEYWSGRLTEASLQLCYAVIAANWLVFGTVSGILQSFCAKLSLTLVLAALATNIIGAWIMSDSMRNRIDYGEADGGRWAGEYTQVSGKADPWPFTQSMINMGIWTRRIKALFTLGGGLAWLVGTIMKGLGK